MKLNYIIIWQPSIAINRLEKDQLSCFNVTVG